MATETVIQRPAPFVEEKGQKLSEQALGLQQVPVVTTGIAGITQQPGETAEGLKARQDAAKAFTTRQQNLAGLAPQVAQQDALQTQAQTLAQQGIGSFQPFLTAAQQALTTAGGLTGSQAYKQFMSPYQQDVIDATLQDFDRQAAMQRQNIGQRAIQAGAFGGGRQGVAEAEYDAASDRNRASILSGLLQQGFGQAQAAADRAFTQQGSLAQAQQGLGQFLPAAQRADIQTLGAVGGIQQSQQQAIEDARRQAAQTAAYEPFQRLNVFGSGVTGLMGGMQNFGDVIKTQPSARAAATRAYVDDMCAAADGDFNWAACSDYERAALGGYCGGSGGYEGCLYDADAARYGDAVDSCAAAWGGDEGYYWYDVCKWQAVAALPEVCAGTFTPSRPDMAAAAAPAAP